GSHDGVKYVDDFIGYLIEELKKRGRDKNTLPIITSDHGESLGEHHLLTHDRALYWELIHVPLLIRFPGQVPTEPRITTPVTTAAIPATILDLLGRTEPESLSVPASPHSGRVRRLSARGQIPSQNWRRTNTRVTVMKKRTKSYRPTPREV